jgi:hypothetical protein
MVRLRRDRLGGGCPTSLAVAHARRGDDGEQAGERREA